MRHFYLSMIGFLAFSAFCKLNGQRFPCDGRLAIATEQSGSTLLSYRLQIPFGPELFNPWVSYPGSRFDALGFNSRDNYVYAVQEKTNAIVRLRQDFKYDTVGIVPIVDTLRSFAGDCTPEGLYLCHESELDQILVFDVLGSFELVNRINLFWDPSSLFRGKFTGRIFDFAINPHNSTEAYSYLGDYEHPDIEPTEARGYLLRINLDFSDSNLGMVTPITTLDKDDIIHLGGLLFSPRGDLFGYGTSPRSFGMQQDRFISINPSSGDISIFHNSINPITQVSDGFTCPYSFSFTNITPADGIYCGGDKKDFVLTINNDSFDDFKDLTLTDTLPEGMIIKKVSGNYNGNIEPGTGIGSRILTITGLDVPPRTELKVIIQVQTIDIEVGHSWNQAFLSNLPEKFGGDIPSDDPRTVGIRGDESFYIIIPWTLEDVTWNVTPPSDCLNANDAQVLITSSNFVVGKEYQIKLRNKIGWEETTFNLIADDNQSIFIDSLIPGDYQLFDFKSLDAQCSFALRDTTIIIRPPNEQLEVAAWSNSPVCEGGVLQLDGSVSHNGNVSWTASDISFASAEIAPSRTNTTPSQSGEYRLKLEYGYCEQTDTIVAIINPKVDASISGKLSYCEGEALRLIAKGDGEELQFQWSGPNNQIPNRQEITNPRTASSDEGYYEVVVDNGGCRDTAGVDVSVLPTPFITLPELIETDYCEPLILLPEITGDRNVKYSWYPTEGLSCIECPNPELLPIIQSRYQLKVINDFNCADSANVRVVLDKKDLFTHPNAFRPNSSNGNSHFGLYPKCVINEIRKLVIFNRWGAEVYSNSNIAPLNKSDFWDGYIQGKIGKPGVYIWTAVIELVDGSIQTLSGDVTLIN